MNGGRFLLSLREVIVSERLLACKSLLKRNILFWNEDIGKKHLIQSTFKAFECKSTFKAFETEIDLFVTEIQAATLDPESKEVGATIFGYITKKLAKRSKCSACKMFLTMNSEIECQYLQSLSRGGLTVSSEILAQFVCSGFAALDVMKDITRKSILSCRKVAEIVLQRYLCLCVDFVCEAHSNWGVQLVTKIIVNVHYSNGQKIVNSIRKDDLFSFNKRHRQKYTCFDFS